MSEAIRVLIVDDEEDYLSSLKRSLGRRGFSVNTSTSGMEALERMKTDQYDCVVLDWNMQGLNGLETLEVLRRFDTKTQVLMLSGHGELAGAVAALKLGLTDFLTKPCDIDELASAIENAAERRRLTEHPIHEKKKKV